jgi:hypothetical protein
MAEMDRQQRAADRRARATLRRTHVQATEVDLSPVRGALAVSLVHRLTREGWSLSGNPEPAYSRREIPCRFVPHLRG